MTHSFHDPRLAALLACAASLLTANAALGQTASPGESGTSSAAAKPADSPPAEAPATDDESASAQRKAQATSENPILKYGSGVIDRPGLRGQISFNLWATSVSGDIMGAGRSASVDESFIDIVQNADSVFGFNGRLEIGSGRFSGYLDGTYMKLGFEDRGDPADPADLTSEISILEFGLIVRAAEWSLNHNSESGSTAHARVIGLDVYGGGRTTESALEFDLDSGASRDPSKTWTSPLVGIRATIDLTDRWNLTVGGDVGGFGVGSDFEWGVSAIASYRFSMWGADAAFTFGYRALGEDFSETIGPDEFKWDIILHGPVIGLVIRF